MNKYMSSQAPEIVETLDREEDKTLVYLGVVVFMLSIGGILITYITRSGGSFR
jgi:hypothetical protein